MNNYTDSKVPFSDRKRNIYHSETYFGCVKDKPNTKGRFAVEDWVKCREVFHNRCHKAQKFLFQHGKRAKNEYIAAFIGKIEEDLGVFPRTQFVSSHIGHVLWVYPSSWWVTHAMRRSLFTILLKSGQRYRPQQKNFEKALYSERYLRNTELAVQRFLKGYTHYEGKIVGWYSQFFHGGYPRQRMNIVKIRKLLVKP